MQQVGRYFVNSSSRQAFCRLLEIRRQCIKAGRCAGRLVCASIGACSIRLAGFSRCDSLQQQQHVLSLMF